MPAKSASKSKHVEVIEGTANILLIAPHACIRNGKSKNDENTGSITKLAAKQLNCSAIINSRYLKPNKDNPRSLDNENLDLNIIQDAEQVPGFIDSIRAVVDQTGKTIVIWIHGAADSSVNAIAKANGFKAKPKGLHAVIGFGQGENPRVPVQRREGKDKESRPSGSIGTINALREALAKNGMTAILTPDGASNFRGRDPGRMNQWFLNKGYPFNQVESIQLEIRKQYRIKRNIESTAKMLADALDELVPASEEVPHATADATPAIITEPVNDERAEETGVGPMTEEPMDAVPDAETVQEASEVDSFDTMPDDTTDTQEMLTAEPSGENTISEETDDSVNPAAVAANASVDLQDDPSVSQTVSTSLPDPAKTKKKPEDPVAVEAFEHLKAIFYTHLHNAMIEAGQYIIDKFYDGKPIPALTKNKTNDQPQSIKNLIDLLNEESKTRVGKVPSLAWFYNAVNLAAHEAIFKEKDSQTFTNLGHSHKLQLLHVPKLKDIQKKIKAKNIEEAINPAFEIKKQLAKHAYDEGLSVRQFKEFIDNEYPKKSTIQFDLAKFPSRNELRKHDLGDLVHLWNTVTRKVENSQATIGLCSKAINDLEIVLAEKGQNHGERKGRFQDWTKSKNNVNICTGCRNDCLYCYMKPFNAKNPKLKQPADWHKWKIRPKDVDKSYGLKDGLVGFPSSHDIFPEILDDYLKVLGKLLRAGNEVLIVTKPCLECIKAICNASSFFKDKILFRFTIGAMDNDILGFWEPNAPTYEERRACLNYAHGQGFRTSVSMEPMLDTDQIEQLIADVRQFVTKDIWLGTMNHLKVIKKEGDDNLIAEVAKVEAGQSPEILTALYSTYEDDPLIKWKTDALKAIFGDGKDIPTDSGASAASNPEEVNTETPLEATVHQVNESIKIVNADFYSWCNDNLEPDSVDLILTDPPYPKEFLHLWDELAEVAARVLKPDRYLVTYSGLLHFDKVFVSLCKHLTYCTTFSLKHTGRTSMVFARKVINTWKPILIFKKGPFEGFDKPINDVISDDKPDKKYHKWGQGEKAFEYLMDSFSAPNDLVLEPFAGGGTTLAVADSIGRRCIGIEKNPKFIDVIKGRLSSASIPAAAIAVEHT